ncbi:CPBP family intramembrane glutamic endopeptidase [Streptococcus merionis]|uniref:CPBP family intramembrane glutamic endopeptidase n=1 Tax=Streptococcus merionis TaxID=400065 RepID=UPI0026EA86D9|nr:CPBP family intramembrane glutamic endopeptidase [Streptococcus merionis]
MFVKSNKDTLKYYLLVTFIITWGLSWGLIPIFKLSLSSSLGNLLYLIGGYGPTIAAFFCLKDKSWKEIKKFLFHPNKGSWRYLLGFLLLQIVVIGLSSRQSSGRVPLHLLPILLLQATTLFGGNEELGWRGVMQPLLEQKLPFTLTTVTTGSVWAVWHLPLWFINNSIQSQFPFYQFAIYAIVLSFVMAVIYQRSQSVFYCSVFHGVSNVLIGFFAIKINLFLVGGLVLLVVISVLLRKPHLSS